MYFCEVCVCAVLPPLIIVLCRLAGMESKSAIQKPATLKLSANCAMTPLRAERMMLGMNATENIKEQVETSVG